MYGDEEGGGFPRDLARGDVGGWADASFDIYDMNLAKSYFFLNQHWHVLEFPFLPSTSLPLSSSRQLPFTLVFSLKIPTPQCPPSTASKSSTPSLSSQPPTPNPITITTTTPHSPSPTRPTRWHRTTATLKATPLILTNTLVITAVATQLLCILGLTLWAGGLVFEVIKALFVTCVFTHLPTSLFPLPTPPPTDPCWTETEMYCTSVEPHPIDTLAVSWLVSTVLMLQGPVMVFAGCEALVKVSFYFCGFGGGWGGGVRANGLV